MTNALLIAVVVWGLMIAIYVTALVIYHKIKFNKSKNKIRKEIEAADKAFYAKTGMQLNTLHNTL